MAIAMQREDLLERREPLMGDFDDLWEELTLAQKFAASSLTQFGYKLNFIRDSHDSHLAVLTCNDNVAVISKVGEINTHPNIQIRL
ncbi:hypothetical protein [Colwellia psychrerythraea]|uniref:Uncharacterized protein n=1 Tax=Colwellia psychrerythraea TaxID=28229 RepID=A0A099KQR9_COLPS|nr:hypothetical protein [Colwellia psychrerythraea]KGJ92232.1 hypothetical protein GAB14E_2820 [Colwellia psychrerythraea]